MNATASPIPPGSILGVLGSGQLGRMFALAARSLGYRVHVFSPEKNTPAGQVADLEMAAEYSDLEKIREFARGIQVLTFEFENVPAEATAAASEIVPVRPSGNVLHLTQNRLREKSFLLESGFPVTPFRAVRSLEELKAAVLEIGLPAVLKTANFGYDGKGQVKLSAADQLDAAWEQFQGMEAIYEAHVEFSKELSVVGARTVSGNFDAFPVFENAHSRHILDTTFAPAAITRLQAEDAKNLAAGILEKLEAVGLLTVEMFLTRDGRLLVNELAPRTHNSGHLTLNASLTSQFEQQVRAVCDLPLGSMELLRPAAMANLLGDLWEGGEPDWPAALQDSFVKLHLYGKAEARPGRKMGHLTASGATVEEALGRVWAARERLSRKTGQ